MLHREAEIRADHLCSCSRCDPRVAVHSARRGLTHVGVRFWDEDPEEKALLKRATILVDGQVVHGAFEAILGEDGTVWRYRGLPSAAREGKHLCMVCRTPGADDDLDPATPLCTERIDGAVALVIAPVMGEG